jgi:hypothetical protein
VLSGPGEHDSQPETQALTPRLWTNLRGRLVLLRHASFVVRPRTATGVSKAAGDAMTLARVLSQLVLPDALKVQDRERRRA